MNPVRSRGTFTPAAQHTDFLRSPGRHTVRADMDKDHRRWPAVRARQRGGSSDNTVGGEPCRLLNFPHCPDRHRPDLAARSACRRSIAEPFWLQQELPEMPEMGLTVGHALETALETGVKTQAREPVGGFYNFERPHHGYRVRGRTPATIIHGAIAAAR